MLFIGEQVGGKNGPKVDIAVDPLEGTNLCATGAPDAISVIAIADDGKGWSGEGSGTGLSIVRALVRDELRGSFDLVSDGGTRAEVVFPA